MYDDFMSIHETVLRDIVDVIHDVKDSQEIKGLRNRSSSFKSIANASDKLTLVFPVIVSSSLSIETASMIVKAIERKAVSMLQILFTASTITDSDNGLDYLKNFHTNLDVRNGVTVDSLIDALDTYVVQKESMIFEDKERYRLLSEDVKRNLNYYLKDLNEHGLHECKIYPDGRIAMESAGKDFNEIAWQNQLKYIKEDNDDINAGIQNAVMSPFNTIATTINNYTSSKGSSSDKTNLAKDHMQMMKDEREMFHKQLVTSDVKKANELVPTMMVVNFVSSEHNNYDVQMIIGVKAKMYPVDSMDIINRIGLKHKDNNSLVKFIRATTREISFFRDFLFAIDKAKLDALSHSSRGSSSPLWKVLERRSTKSKVRRTLGQKNDASAITTLVLSQEEVDYLKKSENINIEDPRVVRPIMESYNFMSMVLVDEATEVAKFIFDTGNDMYENLSFTNLEREANDSGTKKIINLMSKMGGR